MKVAGVLLAAGTGSRFIDPEHKLLTNLHGEPLVTHAARSMTESTLDGYAVVTGAVELNKALTQFTELQIVENPQFDQGIATSLNAATAWALAHESMQDMAHESMLGRIHESMLGMVHANMF